MSDDEKEVIINLGEDDAEGADPVVDLKSQFENIKRKLDDEKSARETAERRAAQAEHRASAGDVAAVDAGISRLNSDIAAAKAELKAAAEMGDFDKQAEAYDRLAQARAQQVRLDEAKADVEVRRITAPPPSDPVEGFLRQFDAPTKQWLRDHPDELREMALNPNGKRAKKITAAHNDAVAEGYQEGAPDYFQYVENFIGGTRKEQQQNVQKEAPRRREAPPVAPVSGSVTGAPATRGEVVRLASYEVRAATDGTHTWNVGSEDPKTGKPLEKNDPRIGQPIGEREFARRKSIMQKQGYYSNEG